MNERRPGKIIIATVLKIVNNSANNENTSSRTDAFNAKYLCRICVNADV